METVFIRTSYLAMKDSISPLLMKLVGNTLLFSLSLFVLHKSVIFETNYSHHINSATFSTATNTTKYRSHLKEGHSLARKAIISDGTHKLPEIVNPVRHCQLLGSPSRKWALLGCGFI